MSQNCSTPPWRYLDPGIKAAVQVLWDAGFQTTDSGDGVSKLEAGRVLDFPHVFCALPGNDRSVDLRDLACRAIELDYSGTGLEPPTPTICEVSYSPLDGRAVLFVGWARQGGSAG